MLRCSGNTADLQSGNPKWIRCSENRIQTIKNDEGFGENVKGQELRINGYWGNVKGRDPDLWYESGNKKT